MNLAGTVSHSVTSGSGIVCASLACPGQVKRGQYAQAFGQALVGQLVADTYERMRRAG